MTKESGAKLGLGAGFYDHDDLRTATDEAAKSDDAQTAVDAAVADADKGTHRAADPRNIEGYAFRTRTHDGIKERIQVPTHKLDTTEEAAVKSPTTKPAAAGSSKE